MSTHAFASAVIDAPVASVWALLRDFTFSKVFSTVQSVTLEEGTGCTVGVVRVVTFKNGGSQRQRLTGLSDVHRTLSYEDIENTEVVSATSASETTITLTRVTQSNATFVTWARDFSSDVTGQNICDTQEDFAHNLKELQGHFSKK